MGNDHCKLSSGECLMRNVIKKHSGLYHILFWDQLVWWVPPEHNQPLAEPIRGHFSIHKAEECILDPQWLHCHSDSYKFSLNWVIGNGSSEKIAKALLRHVCLLNAPPPPPFDKVTKIYFPPLHLLFGKFNVNGNCASGERTTQNPNCLNTSVNPLWSWRK